MLYILLNICAFIITVGTLITIHELGHFIAARLCGVTIQRFSIGFGYILWKFQDKKNTEYIISAIPLGGYVKMLNKNDILITKKHTQKSQETFENKKIWQRALIITAGPIFNIIFSFLIYWFIFVIGTSTYRPIISDIIQNSIISEHHIPCNVEIYSIDNVKTPDWESVQIKLIDALNKKNKKIVIHTISIHSSQITQHIIDVTNWKYDANTQNIITSLGIVPLPTYVIVPIISKIQKNSEAAKADLKIGDQIISVNNKVVIKWEIFEKEIKNYLNKKTLELTIKRKNEMITIKIEPNKNNTTNRKEVPFGISPTYIPISKEYTIRQQFGLIKSVQKAGEKIINLIRITLNALYQLIIGENKLNTLGGPLSIARSAKIASEHGLIPYLTFLSLISINLGIINLFPIPILDGGCLFLLVIEIFFGKKTSERIEKYTYHIGIILLILLMCLSIFNDLSKL